MSVQAMAKVWKESLSGSKKLVKLCLADHANDQGQCWPSLNTIARRTGLSRRYVIELLNELAEEREILREQRGTRSTIYTLVFQDGDDENAASEAGRTTLVNQSALGNDRLVRQGALDNDRLVRQGALPSEAGRTTLVNQGALGSEAGRTTLVRRASPEPSFNHQKNPQEEASRERAEEAEGGELLPGQSVYPEWPAIPDAMTAERVFQRVTQMPTFPGRSRDKDIDRICSIYDRHKFGTVEYLRPFWEAWLGRGYNRVNTDWLDWAISGQIPQPRPNGKHPPPARGADPRIGTDDPSVVSAFRYLEMNPNGKGREGALERLKQKGYTYDNGRLVKIEPSG